MTSNSIAPSTCPDADTERSIDKDESEKARKNPGNKIELTEVAAWGKLGYSFPTWRKWMILSVMFYIQISMNPNASLYANGVSKISASSRRPVTETWGRSSGY